MHLGEKKGPRSGWLRGPDVTRAGRARSDLLEDYAIHVNAEL
jgi:hypothetical protein